MVGILKEGKSGKVWSELVFEGILGWLVGCGWVMNFARGFVGDI